jgi:glycerol-3-phosphate dehydrogenase
MAEDTVNHAITLGKLVDSPCVTQNLSIHGYAEDVDPHGALAVYGSDAEQLHRLMSSDPELAQQLHPQLPYIAAEVIWAAREEMARARSKMYWRGEHALCFSTRGRRLKWRLTLRRCSPGS